MASLTDDRVRSFVLHGTRTGKNRVDRVPMELHTSYLSGSCSTVTTSCSTPAPTPARGDRWPVRVGRQLVVDDDTPPFSFVKIDGTITLHDDLDEVRRITTAMGGSYMGDDRAEKFGRRDRRPRRTPRPPPPDEGHRHVRLRRLTASSRVWSRAVRPAPPPRHSEGFVPSEFRNPERIAHGSSGAGVGHMRTRSFVGSYIDRSEARAVKRSPATRISKRPSRTRSPVTPSGCST